MTRIGFAGNPACKVWGGINHSPKEEDLKMDLPSLDFLLLVIRIVDLALKVRKLLKPKQQELSKIVSRLEGR